LCGPLDAEVSVPELVLQGDLCPHQDYVYFSVPAPQVQKTLSDFRLAVDSFVARVETESSFCESRCGSSLGRLAQEQHRRDSWDPGISCEHGGVPERCG
jgi:hypothetical protein